MANVTIKAPEGVVHVTRNGTTYTIVNGFVTVPDTLVGELLLSGYGWVDQYALHSTTKQPATDGVQTIAGNLVVAGTITPMQGYTDPNALQVNLPFITQSVQGPLSLNSGATFGSPSTDINGILGEDGSFKFTSAGSGNTDGFVYDGATLRCQGDNGFLGATAFYVGTVLVLDSQMTHTANLTLAPTAADFNALLAKLQACHIMSAS